MKQDLLDEISELKAMVDRNRGEYLPCYEGRKIVEMLHKLAFRQQTYAKKLAELSSKHQKIG